MNVPLLNNEQLYQAVRRVNKVPTSLVIYPDQWHGILTPSHRKDLHTRYIAWYDRFLKPGGAVRAPARRRKRPRCWARRFIPWNWRQRRQEDGGRQPRSRAGTFIKTPDAAGRHHLAGTPSGRGRAVCGERSTIYTRGIAKFPADARFYRHRGHRYVTMRQFDKAIADLTKATQLIAGKPDAPEPSTADPAVMSSETLHYAIWYHLGLAHYLKGDFARPLETVYRQCLAVASGQRRPDRRRERLALHDPAAPRPRRGCGEGAGADRRRP